MDGHRLIVLGRLAAVAAITVIGAVAIGCTEAPAGSASPSSAGSSSSPASSSSLPQPSAAGAVPAELVGAWTTTITEEDLRAGGITEAGGIMENAGEFTMTIGADGTWSTSQVSDVPVRWPVFRGTMVTTGADSFRQTTTFPADFAGDVVDFRWSLEDGDLRITVETPPDPILPVIMETHPWQPKG